MKIKCSVCNKYVLQREEVARKAAAKAGYASLEDYVKDYKCRECRKRSPAPKKEKKTEEPKPVEVTKKEIPKIEIDPKTEFVPVVSDEDEDEEEIDQTFESEEFDEEDDDELDEELEEELNNLLEEEDDEEEI